MSTPNCEQVRDLLPELVGLDLPTAGPELASHLESCEACRAEASLLATLRRSQPAVPAALEARVLAAARARPAPRVWTAGWRLAMAATVVAAVIGGSLLLEVVAGGGAGTGDEDGDLAVSAEDAMLPMIDDPVVRGGSLLPSLTEAELESLLARMES